MVEQGSFCEDDVAQFRVDWLYSAVVRFGDHIPPEDAVMNRHHQVAVLPATNWGMMIVATRMYQFKQRLCSLANGEDLAILFRFYLSFVIVLS